MKSINLSNSSALNSTNLTSSFYNSTIGLSALLQLKGWPDFSVEICNATTMDREKELDLENALQNYLLQPSTSRGWKLMALLQKVKKELQIEYVHVKEKQNFYETQTKQEEKRGDGFLADWTKWIWNGMQYFVGSSNAALAEKYAHATIACRKKQAKLSNLISTIDQEIFWLDTEVESTIQKQSMKTKFAQPHLLQSQQMLIPDQVIGMDVPYFYPLNEVFQYNYSTITVVETEKNSLPSWLSLQFQETSHYFLEDYPGDITMGMILSDSTLFIANYFTGLYILNVSDVTNPQLIGKYPLNPFNPEDPYIFGLAISDSTAFIIASDDSAGNNAKLMILNITDISLPWLVKNYSNFILQSSSIGGIASVDSNLYILANPALQPSLRNPILQILNIENLENPRIIKNIDLGVQSVIPIFATAGAVTRSGTRIFIAVGDSAHDDWSLKIFDIKDTKNPTPIGNCKLGKGYSNFINDLTVAGQYVYVAQSFLGLQIVNVTDITHPHVISHCSPAMTCSSPGMGISRTVSVSGSNIYIADVVLGIQIINVSDVMHPQVQNIHRPPMLTYFTTWATVSDSIIFTTFGADLWIYDTRQVSLIGYPSIFQTEQSISLTASAFDSNNQILNSTTFSLTVERNIPHTIGTLSDQTLRPGSTLTTILSSQTLFGTGESFFRLSCSVQDSQNIEFIPSWLELTNIPILLGNHSLGLIGYASSILVSDEIVFIADGRGGLKILDVHDPKHPQLINSYGDGDIKSMAYTIKKSGDILFMANGFHGLIIFDVSDIAHITQLSIYKSDLLDTAYDLTLDTIESYPIVYLATGTTGIHILNVTNPKNPQLLSNPLADITERNNCFSVALFPREILFAACGEAGLHILNISDVRNPKRISDYTGINLFFPLNVSVSITGVIVFNFIDSTLLITAEALASTTNNCFQIIALLDVNDIFHPQYISYGAAGTGAPGKGWISGSTGFIPNGNLGLQIVDVNDKNHLPVLGIYAANIIDVAVPNSIAYTAAGINGLLVLDLTHWALTTMPHAADAGNYKAIITATDARGASASQSFNIRVEGPPQIHGLIPTQYAKVGRTFNYFVPQGLFTDPNFDPLSFNATTLTTNPLLSDWLSFSSISATFTGTPKDRHVGAYEIWLSVTDNIAGTVITRFSLQVNHVPSVVTPLPQPLSLRTGRLFAFQVPKTTFSSWADDPILFYNATLSNGSVLPSWLNFDTDKLIFSGTPVVNQDEGIVSLVAKAEDEFGEYALAPLQLSIVANSPPYLTQYIANQLVDIGDPLNPFRLSPPPFIDPNGDTLTYLVDYDPPSSWLQLNQSMNYQRPPYWPIEIPFNPSTTALTFTGTPKPKDFKDLYKTRSIKITIHAYDDPSNHASEAIATFSIDVRGLSMMGQIIYYGSLAVVLLLASYTAYKNRIGLYNRCCRRRYTAENIVPATVGQKDFKYEPTKNDITGKVRIQPGEVKKVTVVLSPPNGWCSFFKPYRSLSSGLERPHWMEYDFHTDLLRCKRIQDEKNGKVDFLPVEKIKIEDNDQVIVQLKKENNKIMRQFTLFIDDKPIETTVVREEQGKKGNDTTSFSS